MLEPEAAYAHLEDMMALGEGLVSHVVQSVVKNRAPRTRNARARHRPSSQAVKPPFPRITYDEAVEILQKHGNPAKWGDDFGGDEETILSSHLRSPGDGSPLSRRDQGVLHGAGPGSGPSWRWDSTCSLPKATAKSSAAASASPSYDLLVKRLREHNLPEEAFQWYLDLRRYGSVPHAGFGLGLERTVAWICGTEHIREVIPFPRMIYRVYP